MHCHGDELQCPDDSRIFANLGEDVDLEIEDPLVIAITNTNIEFLRGIRIFIGSRD